MKSKIVQLISIQKEVYAVYKEEDGSEYYSPILVGALSEGGESYLLDLDLSSGLLDDPSLTSNFVGFRFGKQES